MQGFISYLYTYRYHLIGKFTCFIVLCSFMIFIPVKFVDFIPYFFALVITIYCHNKDVFTEKNGKWIFSKKI